MTLRTLSRTSGILAVIVTLAAGWLTWMAPAASGLEQDRVTLVENGRQVVDYSPLIGNNPGAQADASTTITTDICAVATACDVIPLTVPDPGHEDDFFVTIKMTWDTTEVPNVPVLGDTALNDLDLWIVDDPFVPTAGPDEDGFHYHSAGADQDEEVQMYRPIGKFNLLVVNATGVNTGYRIEFKWATDAIPTIFESLPPEFSAGTPIARTTPTTAPAPAPLPAAAPTEVEQVALPEPAPVSAPVRPSLELGSAPLPDSSFSTGFGDAQSLDDALESQNRRPIVPASLVKPKAPSALSVLLWLAVLPLLLLAVVAAYLNRRQSAFVAS